MKELARTTLHRVGWALLPVLVVGTGLVFTGVQTVHRTSALFLSSAIPLFLLGVSDVRQRTHASPLLPFANPKPAIAGHGFRWRKCISGTILALTGYVTLCFSFVSLGWALGVIMSWTHDSIWGGIHELLHMLSLSLHVVPWCLLAWGLVFLLYTRREVAVCAILGIAACPVGAACKCLIFGC